MADARETIKKAAKAAGKAGKKVAGKTAETAKKAGAKGAQAALKTKEAVLNAMDVDGNGVVDSTDLILMALKVPGVKIKRDEFLKRELFKYYPHKVIEKAIKTTPAKAGVDPAIVDRIADDVIFFERNAVSGISLALGLPGGAAMAATIPADIAQYYAYMIRAAQKLLYLYGFPELDLPENELQLDSGTLNSLTICLGVMYGVASANNAVKAIAKALGTGVEKKLLKQALTKGAIYPIVKAVAKWFGVNMTKEVFAGFFGKFIPIVGGVIGGGVTFLSFKPCCNRLKDALSDTILSNPGHKETDGEKEMYDDISKETDGADVIIDAEPSDWREVEDGGDDLIDNGDDMPSDDSEDIRDE